MEMSRLTRDGTAESVSREQIVSRERDREILIFPIQLTTSRIGNLKRLILTCYNVMTIHTCIYDLAKPEMFVRTDFTSTIEIDESWKAAN